MRKQNQGVWKGLLRLKFILNSKQYRITDNSIYDNALKLVECLSLWWSDPGHYEPSFGRRREDIIKIKWIWKERWVWISLAEDSVQWRALVKTVLNFQVPQKRKFLASWATTKSSRKFLQDEEGISRQWGVGTEGMWMHASYDGLEVKRGNKKCVSNFCWEISWDETLRRWKHHNIEMDVVW